ncbi:hypothetical protein VCHC62B1_3325A, partial [Vibrio cholerae HC-62B1]
MAFPVPLSR